MARVDVRETHAAADGSHETAPPASVLIVDDHAAIREGLKSALRLAGDFQVVGEATDAAQALTLLQTIHADIVVLDITLPGTNGVELAKAIREKAASSAIVVYTMHGEPALLTAMKKAGVAAYVLKGEPLGTLLEAMQGALEGRKRFPSMPAVDVAFAAAEGVAAVPSREEGPRGRGPGEDRVRTLSGREREIFLRLAQGSSVKQAAFDLGLSPKTVETYKYRLMRKLATDNVVELAKLAIREHLVQP